jgi:hypothetical protein
MDFDTKIYAGLASIAVIIIIFEMAGFGIMSIVSNSMNHDLYDRESFLEFWDSKGYGEQELDSFPLADGFWGGDLLVYRKTDSLDVGDVGAYYSTCSGCRDNPKKTRTCRLCTTIVVHRVSSMNSSYVRFKADNPGPDPITKLDEENVPGSLVIGKVLLRIPRTGMISSVLNCKLNDLKGQGCSLSACVKRGDCN